ncbi:CHASE2 domain-containing protein [Lyngbya aestuarii]|uniref:CHASE2 domain-containing protein n=1 Tax=Lyngbya aestuarii TaxID=118322 RepID=UPI00068FBEB6|nr:CHASE2 domain-containing protein [Lyngbya aestuarii]
MGKVAILKVGHGNFEQGFDVLLQIKTDDNCLLAELEGQLPPNPGLEGCYVSWQTRFRRLQGASQSSRRLNTETEEAWEIDESFQSNSSAVDDFSRCQRLVRDVDKRMKKWLQSSTPKWQCIRERLRVEFAQGESEIRLIIQTKNPRLWKLPWHVWDLLEEYHTGLGYTLPGFSANFTPVNRSSRSNKVRILAVLGDQRNLNLQPDQEAIRKLKGAEVTFLHQPRSTQFIKTLRQPKGWDILFFAGHSKTEETTGRIYLSEKESLRLDEFKNTLKEAINNGLKIAVFNSCDGLGLAQELIQRKIPVAIVMQESVPDVVAQSFLKEFLAEYSTGKPLYKSVYQAQQRLEDYQELPGATWLPLIFQNLADVPPSWQQLRQPTVKKKEIEDREISEAKVLKNRKQRRRFLRIIMAVSASLIAAFLVIFIRDFGQLEFLELKAFDHFMRSRPAETLDSRMLIVDITRQDVNTQIRPPNEGKYKSLNDGYLEELIEKLAVLEPRVIGLTLDRDYQLKPEYKRLINRFKDDDRFISQCDVGEDALDLGRAPSPHAIQGANWKHRIGFSDQVIDTDRIIRRQLLSLEPPGDRQISPCQSELSFNLLMAFRYLADEGIITEEIYQERRDFELGNVTLTRLPMNTTIYDDQLIDVAHAQLLLNYRATGGEIAPKTSLTEVLNGSVDPALVKDKIVLIGTSVPEFETVYSTPYGEMSEIFLQGHMISQLVSAVKDQRQLLGWWPDWKENIWILVWALVGGLLARWFRPAIAVGVAVPMLWVLHRYSYILLIEQGLWIPFVPPALALAAALIATTLIYRLLKV